MAWEEGKRAISSPYMKNHEPMPTKPFLDRLDELFFILGRICGDALHCFGPSWNLIYPTDRSLERCYDGLERLGGMERNASSSIVLCYLSRHSARKAATTELQIKLGELHRRSKA